MLLAELSWPLPVGLLLALLLAGMTCWYARQCSRRESNGFHHPRLDDLNPRIDLEGSQWTIEFLRPPQHEVPPCLIQFRQSGSRLAATAEDADGRRRWFEGFLTGKRLIICEVSRVCGGYQTAAWLLSYDQEPCRLTGHRAVVAADGKAQMQPVVLTPARFGPLLPERGPMELEQALERLISDSSSASCGEMVRV